MPWSLILVVQREWQQKKLVTRCYHWRLLKIVLPVGLFFCRFHYYENIRSCASKVHTLASICLLIFCSLLSIVKADFTVWWCKCVQFVWQLDAVAHQFFNRRLLQNLMCDNYGYSEFIRNNWKTTNNRHNNHNHIQIYLYNVDDENWKFTISWLVPGPFKCDKMQLCCMKSLTCCC